MNQVTENDLHVRKRVKNQVEFVEGSSAIVVVGEEKQRKGYERERQREKQGRSRCVRPQTVV